MFATGTLVFYPNGIIVVDVVASMNRWVVVPIALDEEGPPHGEDVDDQHDEAHAQPLLLAATPACVWRPTGRRKRRLDRLGRLRLRCWCCGERVAWRTVRYIVEEMKWFWLAAAR